MYVELHARSAFSFLEGASAPEELISAALAQEMSAMALLDRDGVYGAPRFHLAAKRHGLRAHIGAEITVGRPSNVQRPRPNVPNTRANNFPQQQNSASNFTVEAADVALSSLPSGETVTLPVLVRNRTGYQNLCRLITLMKLRAPKHARPGECAVTPDELSQHADGLVCLTGVDDGPLARVLLYAGTSELDEAEKTTLWLIETFGKGNVYAELQRHLIRGEEIRNQQVVEIARRFGLPLLATNGISYASRERRELADVFTCLRNHVRLTNAGQLLATNSERYLKPAKEMCSLFSDLPEAIKNTESLSSRLEFTLEDLGYEFPKYPVPGGETMATFLRQRTEEGARERYTGWHGKPSFERAWKQIERELKLVEKLKLEGYFLIVWDIVQFCKQQGILIQGRGSAANSAVCYSLGITAVDPISMELLFERFLSEERGEWPDIDLDLPSGDHREQAIQYVYERYGKLGAAMTANVITYRGRSAVREVGKVLDFEETMLARLSALVHTWEWKDPKDSTERQFRDAGLSLQDPQIRKFFELYQLVQDLPRHLGQHSGGMVICQGQLDSVVPLEPAAMPGRVVVQWDKEDCADLGLIKVDLLGLGMMAVLEDSIVLIRDAYKENVDLAHLPQNDSAVYEALQKADTIGMFQVESRAQMSCLPRLRPEKFYDIVVQVAIIRPGPIVGNMVHPFLKRRQGRAPVVYPHPLLEPVLKRTLGVPLFQEQLLKMAMICAGFSGGEAEELRRAFGFKRSEARMKDVEVKLRRGMKQNGITGSAQDEIVQAITSFALYGFPESHAASFALIAYASAYLKCHYLAAFTAAILNNQPMGFYQPFTLIKDAQRHGLKVRPVDVTKSSWLCTVEDEAETDAGMEQASQSGHNCHLVLRLGLNYVKGLRESSGRAIELERRKRFFSSIDDLCIRIPELRKDELRKLAAVGALNFIRDENMNQHFPAPQNPQAVERTGQKLNRRAALWQVERVTRTAGPLYRQLEEKEDNSPLLPMTVCERMDADFRGTGLTVGRHPVAYQRDELRKLGALRAIDTYRLRDGTHVVVAGWVIVRQRPGTAKGFLFLTLEDETGVSNIIVTPQLFEKNRIVLTKHPFLLIEGTLQNQDRVVSVKAKRIRALSFQVAATASHDFH